MRPWRSSAGLLAEACGTHGKAFSIVSDGPRARAANISEHQEKILALNTRDDQLMDANKNEHPMHNEPSINSGLTRRSFIKRSVVATVALSTTTVFSGLANAGLFDLGGLGYFLYQQAEADCGVAKEPTEWLIDNDHFITIFSCYANGDNCLKMQECGQMFKIKPGTSEPLLDQNGNPVLYDVWLNCAYHRWSPETGMGNTVNCLNGPPIVRERPPIVIPPPPPPPIA